MVTRADDIEIDLGEPRAIPDRSVLYHLKPIARGTALRESLSSFLLRLADEHTMNPSALSFIPGIDRRCRGPWACNVWTQPYFKGAGVVAKIWACELARLTGHNRLDDLTLLPLARVVNVGGLAHKARKWCPQCLREQEREGVPYGQLLWEIAAVGACPVHAIRLLSTCRCGEAGVNTRTVKRLPHICPSCCRRLTESSQSCQAPLELLQRARMVADLLDDPDFNRDSWPAEGFSQFLIGAARRHFKGGPARMASILGVHKVTVHGWAHYGRRPTLERVVKLAEVFGCQIRSVLQGEASHTQLRATARLSSRRPKRDAIPPELRKGIPRQMRDFQRRKKALSLNQVVRELGVSEHYLRRNYRATCDAIVARFQQQCAAETEARRNRLMQLFRSRVKAIVASGTKLNLHRAMGPDSLRLIPLRDQCRQIIDDLRNQTRT